MTDYRAMKKVELHLHIEGAAPPAFIKELADEQSVDLSGIFEGNGYRWRDFPDFLKTYEAACEVLRGPDEFKRLMKAVLEEQAAHGVIYTEHFLASDLCGDGSPAAWDEHLAAMNEGAKEAEAEHGIVVRFIPTCIRHFGAERAVNAARIAADTAGGRVTGFGMGGAESLFTPADFAPAFEIAEEAGLGLTCHAGEIEGPEMVRATLDAINVTRIGHGVRAIEDEALVRRLVDEEITLECNPGSNVSLQVFPNWESHSITSLEDAGVKVTISTDDPPYFHTDMTREYEMLAKTHGWDEARLRRQNKVAMDAAFCDDATRARITAML